MTEIKHITEEVKTEIQIDLQGIGKVSMRGAAKLSDVFESSIRRGLTIGAAEKVPALARFLIDQGIEAAALEDWKESGIPDIGMALILEYYGYEAQPRYRTERAKQFCRSYMAIGIRVWLQGVAGWQDPTTRHFTPDEITQICLLPSGRDWQKRFDDDYYRDLARLTSLEQFGNSRPPLWGKLTDEWVYQMLPVGVREGVREAREKHGNWQKLHQFLSDDGLKIFEQHMNTLIIVMRSSETVNGVRRALKTLTKTEYQLRLFDDCRKDGKLTVSRQLRLLDNKENKQA